MYDEVGVAPVFARNVLFPQGLARFADAMAYNDLKGKIEKHQKQTAAYVSTVEQMIAKLQEDDAGVVITRKANDQQHLYGSIHEQDIADELNKKYNIQIDAHHLTLPQKLDTIGKYHVVFDYKGLQKDILIDVVKENEPVTAE